MMSFLILIKVHALSLREISLHIKCGVSSFKAFIHGMMSHTKTSPFGAIPTQHSYYTYTHGVSQKFVEDMTEL